MSIIKEEELFKEIQDRLERGYRKMADQIVDDLVPSDSKGYYRTNAMDNLLNKVTDRFVARWLEENYAKIAAEIDTNRVAKMSELAAIGKVSGTR